MYVKFYKIIVWQHAVQRILYGNITTSLKKLAS
jgi:hypothetical protein